MKRILWLGPVVHQECLNNSEALSPAANAWQINFINGLIKNKAEVLVLTYIPMRAWPAGNLWVTYPKVDLPGGIKFLSTSYLNLPFIRDWWISLSLYLKANKYSHYNLISYNPVSRHRIFAYFTQKLHKIKWISIVADKVFEGRPFATVFLSYGYFKKAGLLNKYFFEGGVPLITVDNRVVPTPKVLLYAGSITKWTGIVQFTELFDRISDKVDLELHIYGNGDPKEIISIAAGNSKIKFLGFVSPEMLDIACRNAYAFINPRPIEVFQGENNFPSKVLFYLSYQKPVISTYTAGLSPDYKEILLYYDYNNVDSLIDTVNGIDDNTKYSLIMKRIKNFNETNTWENKIKNLLISLNIN